MPLQSCAARAGTWFCWADSFPTVCVCMCACVHSCKAVQTGQALEPDKLMSFSLCDCRCECNCKSVKQGQAFFPDGLIFPHVFVHTCVCACNWKAVQIALAFDPDVIVSFHSVCIHRIHVLGYRAVHKCWVRLFLTVYVRWLCMCDCTNSSQGQGYKCSCFDQCLRYVIKLTVYDDRAVQRSKALDPGELINFGSMLELFPWIVQQSTPAHRAYKVCKCARVGVDVSFGVSFCIEVEQGITLHQASDLCERKDGGCMGLMYVPHHLLWEEKTSTLCMQDVLQTPGKKLIWFVQLLQQFGALTFLFRDSHVKLVECFDSSAVVLSVFVECTITESH